MSFSPRRSVAGSALVIVLALVTVLTFILVAYFNLVLMDWMATKNYAQGIRAEQVSRGAMDYIVGQLRLEMADGTTPMTVGSYSIFTNITSANVGPGAIGSDTAMPDMVKMSKAGLGLYANAPSSDLASTAATDVTSANGRRVSRGRWGRPGLGTPSLAPAWFLLGSNGVVQSPSTDVQGRFACVIYDLASLVDLNVAGFPATLSASQKRALQGSLAKIDLGAIPGMNAAASDALLTGFRNRTSASSAGAYTNYVLGAAAANGFLRVVSGDDTFVGRQDLLGYAKINGLSDAMTNFTTFTRTVDTPSWAPATNAGTVPVQTMVRSSMTQWNPQAAAPPTTKTLDFNYANLAFRANSTNAMPLVQSVSAAFTRVDDTAAAVGEPLLLKRFPLSRLAWLSWSGPSAQAVAQFGNTAAAGAKIKAAFGLVWDPVNRLWVYTSPSSANGGGTYTGSGTSDGPASSLLAASGIKTLATIASENREPDFFELLRMGILKGSLGQRSDLASPVSMPLPGEVTPEGHIFQIGANIIDQYDADDYPTLIRAYMPIVMEGRVHAYDFSETVPYVLGRGVNGLTPHDFAGVENLPYIEDLRGRVFRTQAGDATGYRPVGEALLIPQFWNPHQNAGNVSANRPAQLRLIQTFGSIHAVMMGNKEGAGGFSYAGYETYPPSEWPSPAGRAQPSITFNGGLTFAQPGLLKQSDVLATSVPENLRPAILADPHTMADVEPTGMVGLYLGRTPVAGTDHIATTPADAINDNTPVDASVWAVFTGGTAADCPVQQYVDHVALPTSANGVALPPGDPFWKGDTMAASASNIRYPVFELQYLDAGVWKTYQRFDGLLRGGGSDYAYDTVSRPANFASAFVSESYDRLYARIDPRGGRFGLVNAKDPAHQTYSSDWNGDPSSYRTAPVLDIQGNRGRPSGGTSPGGIAGNQSGAQFTTEYDPGNQWSWGAFCQWLDNIPGSEHYTDCDQVLRRGDGNTGVGVNPLAAAGSSYRPVMLNRAFTSVADLGYVFRDLPFKTLDLFSDRSADGGLLDLFCVADAPVLSAGVVNLNAKSPQALAQLLAGTITDETGGGVLSASDAQAIAQGLVKTTGGAPLNGIADLPRFLASTDYTGAVSGDLRNIKTQMEAVPRGLSGVADTRCWNLLIDVVAQSGFYAGGVTDPTQFVVQGERRYWLSIAIDRVTGKIVDEQLEPVWE